MTGGFDALSRELLRAKRAADLTGVSTGPARDAFLTGLAKQIFLAAEEIAYANSLDVAEGRQAGLGDAVIDRLAFDVPRISQLAQGLTACAALPDPLGVVEGQMTLPSGLVVGRRRIPLGLIGFICEARPGAVVEAAAMAVKSGNALFAKPGRDSRRTTAVLGRLIAEALIGAELPAEAVFVRPELTQEELIFMIGRPDVMDLVIPRGGQSLISLVDTHSRVPVLRHFQGVNHLYVDETAPLDMALELTINGKCQRPATCNALECLLIHRGVAGEFVPAMAADLSGRGVELLGDPESVDLAPVIKPAGREAWGREFQDLILAVKVVGDLRDALEHIRVHGSRHTEAICTSSLVNADTFLRVVDAGCVLVNASTRLNDGGCLGLGAEIGISTTKLHAYGPMGLKELTTTKFVVTGQGHLR